MGQMGFDPDAGKNIHHTKWPTLRKIWILHFKELATKQGPKSGELKIFNQFYCPRRTLENSILEILTSFYGQTACSSVAIHASWRPSLYPTTTGGKGGAYLFDIHFWIGKDTTQDEAGTAAMKSVELDAALGGRAVQHRELQGFESDKFLSYFKPCIIPLEGGVASGFNHPEEDKFETRLYVCKGKRVAKLKQVPFARASLNHDDIFILDTENKIYQFNGSNSNIQERAKALEVIQYLKDCYHEGHCDVGIIDDGKLVAESDSGEFWVLFGGYAPIGRKPHSEDDVHLEMTTGKLYSIMNGQLKEEEGPLTKAMLENNRCYILDCQAEVFVWVGRVTQLDDRKAANQAAEELILNQSRPKSTLITRVIQGYETQSFKTKFDSWPAGTVNSSGEEGRGKVVALLKQKGVDVKGTTKGATAHEDIPTLLEGGGKLEVWRIDGSAKTPIPPADIGKFYGGDCYIVLYTYHSAERKEDYFLCSWIGKDSIQDDRKSVAQLADTIFTSLKGKPVQGRIIQGKEPPQFIALFQPMVLLKGGASSGYKKFIEDENLNIETYTPDSVALFQVSNTSVHNNKALQVDAVGSSLNSSDCFLLQTGSTSFIWHGSSCTFEQQHWAVKVAEFLKPGVAVKHTKEGTESSAFWGALGGKQSPSSKTIVQEPVRDPHLYTFSLNKGNFEVHEIFNYSQDDLLTEDMLILDTRAEIFVWVGHSVDLKEKQMAFEIGQKYIELAVAFEGLSLEVPLYKIPEGHEPCFFTTCFSWDNNKATVYENSFAKKLSFLFGAAAHGVEAADKSSDTSHDGPTQRASALAALSSAFNPASSAKAAAPKPIQSGQGSQRAAAVAALSGVLTAEQKKAAEASSTRISRSSSPVAGNEKNEDAELEAEDAHKVETEDGDTSTHDEAAPEGHDDHSDANHEDSEMDENESGVTYSYERLKSKSTDPVTGINYKKREAYLSDAEFESVLGMTKSAFYSQPKWKQDIQKKKVDLF